MIKLIVGLGMLCSLGMTATPSVEPQVMYANEVETPVETPFEQVVYTNEEAQLKITLTSETECSVEMTNNGETRVKDNVPYSIVENELTIVLNEQNFTFVIGENNTLTPKEIEPIEPQEPEWIMQEYKMLVSETDTDINEYILILTSETEFRFINKYTNKASEQTVSTEASGTYTKRWKKIELYCDQELPFYEIEIDQDSGTFKEYVSIIDKGTEILTDTEQKIAYYMNLPLPIIGVSTMSILGILWFIFSHTSFGKKRLRVMEAENKAMRKELDEREKSYQAVVDAQNAHIEKLESYISTMSSYSRVDEVKNIGKEIENGKDQERKETTDNGTKEA